MEVNELKSIFDFNGNQLFKNPWKFNGKSHLEINPENSFKWELSSV